MTPLTRVVLEKPIGRDLASAQPINDEVGQVFAEEQTYRIDHYLGKETVQNLMVLRFANVAVRAAVELRRTSTTCRSPWPKAGRRRPRSATTTSAGALRDMVQNHMLQLLCLVAMEPPAALRRRRGARREAEGAARAEADRRRATSRTAHRARPVPRRRGRRRSRAGLPGGARRQQQPTPRPSSRSRPRSQNWRWAGVPFYLRTGKRLPARVVRDRGPVPQRAALDLPRGRAGSWSPTGWCCGCSRTRA